MATKQHAFDTVAQDLSQWVVSMVKDLTAALTEGDVAPFAANVTQAQKIQFFASKVYLPDGSINVQGRSWLMSTYGPEGYATVMRAVLKSQGGLPPIPPLGGPMPTAGPQTIPTEVPGVAQVVGGGGPQTEPTGIPGVAHVIGS